MLSKFSIPKIVASVFGVGFIGRGGGTVAAILYCVVWYFLPASFSSSVVQFFVIALLIMAGTWSGNIVDASWGKDSSKVVIDEVAGMAIALLYIPHQLSYLLLSLAAFRFYDILKPLGIRKAEKLPKGWGVMADDILAGLYALLSVFLFMYLQAKSG